VHCTGCGAALPSGAKFCMECGTPVQAGCSGCGAPLVSGAKFCMECGRPASGEQRAEPRTTPPSTQSVAERRVTSVLFGDLVGFTPMAESRDPEEVREILSRYFAEARTVVERYGGTVEKFIGDAVMAVWGVPVAHEDDAERAVRAGLDLVAEVIALGEELGVTGLTTRVGIVTGEVAVTLGAVGEGMVAGDAVNTAARVQAAAVPGQVWVDDTTRSLTAAAVSYDDAGEHLLKGKSESLRLFAARAVVAAMGGSQRVDGLEAPFTGRDRELRLVKELFHSVVEDGRPRMVAVWGTAGVGKSRLGWEFEKYVDGIDARMGWHRGRALSYGDGVAFWALAEMVRSRLGIADGDPAAVQQQRLAAALAELVPDAAERDRLAGRLAVLLGLEGRGEAASYSRQDLFAAWTSLFERVAAGRQGVVLLFEDMQYADSGLLDFIEHLVESARFPVFVLAMSRPELAETRPQFGTGRRATPVYLEPLADAVMGQLVDGLVAGLPAEARDALTARSEGIPLYAVETVRALIDSDTVIPRGGRYVLADDAAGRGDLGRVGAPSSLQALIAARLDALSPDERRVVGEASVHGMMFSREALLAATPVDDLDACLASLVRKEIVALHEDVFSPERGQYRFVQALVRTVAYDTLSRRDRKSRHLAVAALIAAEDQGDELAGVQARHYLDALDSAPGDDDADDLRRTALGLLERAALRARSLGSAQEALQHYTTALERAPEPEVRARLHEGAARAAKGAAREDAAQEHAEQARELYLEMGRPIDAARVLAIRGASLINSGRLQEAADLMTPVYQELQDEQAAHREVSELASELARLHAYMGSHSEGERYAKRALQSAEARSDWPQVVELLMRYGTLWIFQGMPTGGLAMLRSSVDLAREHDLPYEMLRPLGNVISFQNSRDLVAAEAAGREALEIATRLNAGDRRGLIAINLCLGLWSGGRWDELEDVATLVDDEDVQSRVLAWLLIGLVRSARGTFDATVAVDDLHDEVDDPYQVGAMVQLEALRAAASDDMDRAADLSVAAIDASISAAGIDDDFALYWPLGVEYSLLAGDVDRAERLLQPVTEAASGVVTPLVHAQLFRLRGMIAAARGDLESADGDLSRGTDELRAFGAPYYLARTLLSLAEVRRDSGLPASDLLDEARAIFDMLGARPWVEATRRAAAEVPA
jgi:class 3 adenylate cyclase/tetratricopeptide (TPR) repeat protein